MHLGKKYLCIYTSLVGYHRIYVAVIYFSIRLSTGIPSLNSALRQLVYFACLKFCKMSVHGTVPFTLLNVFPLGPAAISMWQERAFLFAFFIMFIHVSLLGFSATLKAGLLNLLFKLVFCTYNWFCIYVNIILHSTQSKEKKSGNRFGSMFKTLHITLVARRAGKTECLRIAFLAFGLC